MTLRSRQIVRLGILFLVVRVLADIATPHAPGAFRLDPRDSVEAAGAPHQAIAVAIPAQPSRTLGDAVTRHGAQPRLESRSTVHVRTFFPRILHPSESTGSPPASDDD
jgi:hypothetical protein